MFLSGITNPSVDNAGHFGGLVGGVLLGIYVLPKMYVGVL